MELCQCTRHCRTPNSYSSFRSSSGRRSNCAVTTIVQIQTSVRELLQGYWYFQCYCASLLLDLSVLGWLRAAEPRRPEAPGGRNKSARANWATVYVGQIFTQNGSGRCGPRGATSCWPEPRRLLCGCYVSCWATRTQLVNRVLFVTAIDINE